MVITYGIVADGLIPKHCESCSMPIASQKEDKKDGFFLA
jgi:hypothetical protein